MSFSAFVLIFLSIMMHSLWHFLSKSSGKPSFAFFSIFSFSLFCTMLPFALASGLIGKIPFDVLKFAVAGGICGGICDIGLMYAYKYSEISLAYPTARALPVFFTVLVTSLCGWGKSLTVLTWFGMMIIFSGCMLMAFSNSPVSVSTREKISFIKKGLPGIMLAALGTTAYTIIDSFGIKAMMEFAADSNKFLAAGTYSCMREFPAFLFLSSGCLLRTVMHKDKGVFTGLMKSYHPYLAGVFAAGAYVLVLLAMNDVTNVSYVQAFRQLSLPFSAFLGYYILKEKITPYRWIALCMIMAGLFITVI